jgi:predicted ester cyclase
VEDQVAEGNKVVTRFSGGGRHTGNLLGAPSTGKGLRWTGIIISRFENGKIAEEWAEFDGLALLQQLGLVPKMS